MKRCKEKFSTNSIQQCQALFLFESYQVDTSNISEENIFIPYLKKYNDIMSPDLMNEITNDFFTTFYDNYRIQKKFRTSLKEVISLKNPALVNLLDMPLYKYLLSDKDIIQEKFYEIMESFLSLSQKTLQTIPHGEKITTSYKILDFFPAYSEKIKKKNNIKNISTDAEHLFLGSCAKYFIDSDNNMLEKASVVFNKFNVRTKLYHKKDFINKISFI